MSLFDFDRAVPPGGYSWWYADAISEDESRALTVIAFVGSVFSPYYAWSGRGDPENHCAINVGIYGAPNRWTMTERKKDQLTRAPQFFQAGPSSLRWDGDALVIDIEEIAFPKMMKVRGQVRIHPEVVNDRRFVLDGEGLHTWRPIAPRARAEVSFDTPNMNWSGPAYVDSNAGDEPLEAGFRCWDWSRSPLKEGSALLYHATRMDGSQESLALRVDRHGGIEEVEGPARVPLKSSFWRVDRVTQSEGSARVARTLLDTPFYARSLVEHEIFGERAISMHESLDLTRFSKTYVKWMLPFRMPRR